MHFSRRGFIRVHLCDPWPIQALIAIPYTLFDASSMASASVGCA